MNLLAVCRDIPGRGRTQRDTGVIRQRGDLLHIFTLKHNRCQLILNLTVRDSQIGILDGIAANADRFSHITKLFIGDMDYEVCEVSWIMQGNYSMDRQNQSAAITIRRH